MKSDLDTISLKIGTRDAKKAKFLIDTCAKISIIKESSLNEGASYQPRKSTEIKGIGNTVLKTDCIVELKLLTEKHETVHNFHVLSEPSALQCDGILGNYFLEERECVINYCSRQIIMNNEVVINFDEKSCVDKLHRVN